MSKVKSWFYLVTLAVAAWACNTPTTPPFTTETTTLKKELSSAELDSIWRVAGEFEGKSKMDVAVGLWKKIITTSALVPDSILIRSYYAIGKFYVDNNHYEVADDYLEKAQRLCETSDPDDLILLDIYRELVVCKRELRDFPLAISITQQLITKAREHSPPLTGVLVNAYDRMASVYFFDKQHELATSTWQKALSLAPDDNHRKKASINYNLALVHAEMNKNSEALVFFDKAIREDFAASGPESKELSGRLLSKAFVLLDNGAQDSALFCLRESLRIRMKHYDTKSSYIVGSLYAIGEYHFRTGNFDSAAWYHHRSLISSVASFQDQDIFENPKPSPDEINNDLVSGLVSKAAALRKIFDKDTTRTDILRLSLQTTLLADSVFEEYLKQFSYEDPQLKQLEQRPVPYDFLLETISILYQKTREHRYLEAAFRVMERSRAVVLKRALNRAEFYSEAGLPDRFRQKENELLQSRSELVDRLINSELSRVSRDSIGELLIAVDRQYNSLLEEVALLKPNYFQVRYEKKEVSLSEMMKLMGENESVWVEYYWGTSAITVLSINASFVKLAQIPIIDSIGHAMKIISDEVQEFTDESIRLEKFRQFQKSAHFLFRVLVHPFVDDGSSRVVISPDGPLSSFPFEVLLTSNPEGNEVDYHLPYFLLKHSVSYHYSSTYFAKYFHRSRHGQRLLALGYAGQEAGQTRQGDLEDLPGTQEEVLALKKVMPSSSNEYLLEQDATEKRFKQQVSDFNLIHLAIHGTGDTLNAMQSRLIFRRDERGTEDGKLFAHELYGLPLDQLDMAVLSACESGVGKMQAGEGVMSIARGFVYAGCPTLIISLWKISDKTSPLIMADFYRLLTRGNDVGESLTEAKANYLRNANMLNAHPSNWAAFLAVGEMKPIVNDRRLLYIGLAGLIALVLAIAARRRFGKRT